MRVDSPSAAQGLISIVGSERDADRRLDGVAVPPRIEKASLVPPTVALNSAQREAVEHGSGPLLVLAGAGSGKTRVVTHRIVRLIERGIPPQAMVALTFTNKAAAEMRQRVAGMLGSAGAAAARSLTVSTFHSFGLYVLGRERQAIGGAFTIFDQGDQTSLVKQLLRLAGADRAYDAQAVIARISAAKNAFLPPDGLPQRDEYDEIASVLYPRYQAALRQYRAYDFDDLVCEVARLWRDHETVRARWQQRFLHLLVDEYQDTNRAQLEMLRLLCGDHQNICAVGDDDQSIYGWRGADVRNILEFEEHFAHARVVKLEHNYRSRRPILEVANAIIAKRPDAKWRKVLFTDRPGGEPVRLAVAPTPESEAAWVARQVRRLVRDEGVRPREVAVLYRSNGQSRLLEEPLREQGISHRVIGGMQFFERKEVKDVLAYVKLALNPADEISLRRVVNYPARSIGEATLEKMALHAAKRQWTLWQAIERADALDDVPTAALAGCRSLTQLVAATRAALFGEKRPPSEVVRDLCERVRLKEEIDAGAPAPGAAAKRWANIEWLFGVLARREARGETDTDGLSSFMHALTMGMESEAEDAGDVVTLSTLHGSKGLEFDVVFLVGCEEGYLPHARTLDVRATDTIEGGGDIEEERRLIYVGVTRARQQLVLSRAKCRVLRGKAVARTPSRFLSDVPPDHFEQVEINDESPTTAKEAAANAGAILALLR
jgi:ATP-dependent DNA helicase Rep